MQKWYKEKGDFTMKYEKANAEVIYFTNRDVIATSMSNNK